MKKLTAEKCRGLIARIITAKELLTISTAEECYLQALEIALPILEQQERGCESCGGNSHVEIDHGELGIEHMTCDKCTVTSGRQERGGREWIEWRGGECPVADDRVVRVRYRGDFQEDKCIAGSMIWNHSGEEDDIIAYRIIPEQPTNQNGEQ